MASLASAPPMPTDAAAALGFVHARDRLFQMELMRRAASGRLSEIAGPATLALDRSMRTLGLRRRAVADYPALPAETRAMLEAYARGVNAWIAERGRFSAPEFLFLGAPEPWEPVDSLLWGQTMGLWLSLNWRTELSRQSLAGRVPQQMIDELWPPAAGDGRPEAALAPGLSHAAAELAAVLPRFPDPYTLPQLGIERVGGGRPPYRDRRAAARRRSASGVRLSRHLVPGADRDAGRRAGRRHRAGRAVPGARPQRPHRLELHHHGRRCAGRVHRDAGGRRPVPDARRPPPLRRARGAHQGARRARPGPDRARDAPRPGDERPARQRWTDPGRGDGQSGARQYRGRRPARAQSGARRGRRRQGRRDDHRAGAEPAGGRSRAHRALCHRPRADPPRRRRFGPGAGRRLA